MGAPRPRKVTRRYQSYYYEIDGREFNYKIEMENVNKAMALSEKSLIQPFLSRAKG